MSMPARSCIATTSRTAPVTAVWRSPLGGAPSWWAYISRVNASGRGRLPTCVVSIRLMRPPRSLSASEADQRDWAHPRSARPRHLDRKARHLEAARRQPPQVGQLLDLKVLV